MHDVEVVLGAVPRIGLPVNGDVENLEVSDVLAVEEFPRLNHRCGDSSARFGLSNTAI